LSERAVAPIFEPVPPDLAAALERASPVLAEFGALRYCAEAESTNDLALELAAGGAAAGTSVLADFQRAGRGRRGHGWFSPPGAGLYLSMILRPVAPAILSLVTLAAGAAVAASIGAAYGLPVELKWPNDIVIGRPWRKLGGLLCEAVGTGPRVAAVIVGVGVNLRQVAYPRDIVRTASSIEGELGRGVERTPLVVEILAATRRMAAALAAGDDEAIRREWRRFGHAGMDADVRWHDQGIDRRGRARDIDIDGALLVESGGRVERLIAGDIRWELFSGG
jgi:BirA family biotin operon repressor/biotin-[acetyl-CoA-carboxylase] ligase